MQWLSSYEGDLGQAFTKAEHILSGLPTTFSQPALAYLDKFHVLKADSSKNYICYLLPFWLQDNSGVSINDCRNFAVANIFGMMYYHLIDELMDEPEAKSAHQLPLANLIHFEFTQIYSNYFPSDSPFWSYYKKYVTEWAEAVTHEQHRDYFQEAPSAIAHKASPVKLSIVSSLLLIEHDNQEELIPLFEDAVDTVLITLQMLDDWKDWEKDLQEGSYNCLISMVQSNLQIHKARRPTHEEITQALYASVLLSHYAQRAETHHESLRIIEPYAPRLYEFHAYLCQNIHEGANHIEKERNLLQQGGLAYWLSKNS
ncbi:hypothetical protein EJP82_10860 [Paenibacillus anaericanus]|uniref:Uncharacterized protein n=1 Tax=Paenibacillus anaericanus TaxID=170367 RepID=A0A3S1DQG8_9BACL|nr:hypothetical protein [Paenibacillus anaericanus]RUT46729.1 hypothetical protein EJP82_10860 [Paenibacillus anaericanus]